MADIYGVLLAAGFSTRFGSNKLLTKINGRPLIECSAAALSPCDHIIAVVRADDDAVLSTLNALDIDCVINAHPERGMGYSIACAVNGSLGSSGWCLLPADMPYINPSTTQKLIDAMHAGSILAAPFYQGRRGHPVAFNHQFGGALTALDGDNGARGIIEQHAERLSVIVCDDAGVLLDVDTADQLIV